MAGSLQGPLGEGCECVGVSVSVSVSGVRCCVAGSLQGPAAFRRCFSQLPILSLQIVPLSFQLSLSFPLTLSPSYLASQK